MPSKQQMWGEPHPGALSSSINVYGILSGGETNVTVTESNVSLGVIKERFLSWMVDREVSSRGVDYPEFRASVRGRLAGVKRVQKDKHGRLYVEESGGAIEAALHGVYDGESGVFHLVNTAYSPALIFKTPAGGKHDKLVSGMARWLSEKYGRPIEQIKVSSGPVPIVDYEVCLVSDYPAILSSAKRLGIDLSEYGSLKLVFVNYENETIREQVESSLGASSGSYMSVNQGLTLGEGESPVEIMPPFVLVDISSQGTVHACSEAVLQMLNLHYSLALEGAGDDQEKRAELVSGLFRDYVRANLDQGAEPSHMMRRMLHSDVSIPETSRAKASLDRLGVTDPQARDFLLKYMVLSKIQEFADRRKLYYYVAAGNELKNRPVFDQLFGVISSRPADGGAEHLLVSYFCFPTDLLGVFGLRATVMSRQFDASTGVLSVPRPEGREEEELATSEIIDGHSSFPQWSEEVLGHARAKAQEYGTEVIDLSDRCALVRSLGSFPMVYAELRKRFDENGVQWKDIRVLLVWDQRNLDQRGGYRSPSHQNVGAAALQQEDKIYEPPVITINIACPEMGSDTSIADTLLHEGTHYMHDLMVQQGLASPSLMYAPEHGRATSLDEFIGYIHQYLSESPTEFKAWALRPELDLESVDIERLKRYRPQYKGRILRLMMGDKKYNSYPLAKDAAPGDMEVTVAKPPGSLDGGVSILDRHAGPEPDPQVFDTVKVESVEGQVVHLSAPLKRNYWMVDGAYLQHPSVPNMEIMNEWLDSLSGIIDYAFDEAIRRHEAKSSGNP